jgi:hypothetical protein
MDVVNGSNDDFVGHSDEKLIRVGVSELSRVCDFNQCRFVYTRPVAVVPLDSKACDWGSTLFIWGHPGDLGGRQ